MSNTLGGLSRHSLGGSWCALLLCVLGVLGVLLFAGCTDSGNAGNADTQGTDTQEVFESTADAPILEPLAEQIPEVAPGVPGDGDGNEEVLDAAGSDTPDTFTDKTDIIEYTRNSVRAQIGTPAGAGNVDESTLTEPEVAALARARLALVQHLEIAEADGAQLISISAAQWTSSSLGCGAPGEMSAQVMQDGYKVVLVLEGLRHQVHVGRSGARVCERLQGLLQAPKRVLNLGALPGLQEQAISQLAEQYQVPESEIAVETVQPASWPDASLGCPEPGRRYLPIETSGYRLPFVVAGKRVEYHTDGKRLVQCAKERQVETADF